jgi:hypothetical protein
MVEDVDVRWLDEVDPWPVEWVPGLTGRVPRGALTLLAGKRDIGKSQASGWLVGQAAKAGAYCWVNSKEDDVHRVLRPRFDALGVDQGSRARIALSERNYDLPADLLEFMGDAIRGAGHRNDLIVIDSLQGHVHQYESTHVLLRAFQGLKTLAQDADLGVVLVSHMIKSNAPTPEQAIAGPGGLQNQTKAIFILGPQPQTSEERLLQLLGADDDEQMSNVVLACERMSFGPKPPSLAFTKTVRWHEETGRGEPFLELQGESTATSSEVYAAVKRSEREPTPDEKAGATLAAAMIRILSAVETNDGWMSTADFNDALVETGFKPEGGTYSRAREFARVLSKKEGDSWWVKNGWAGLPLPE